MEIINFNTLQKQLTPPVPEGRAAIPPSPAKVRAILRQNKIKYFQDPMGRPWTTSRALDYALYPELLEAAANDGATEEETFTPR